MNDLTKEEMQFLINILGEITVPVKNPNAGQLVAQSQSCINKLSKMIDEIDKPIENLDKQEESAS